MSIDDRLKVLKIAEIDCEASIVRARDSWTKLSTNFKTAATPWRIAASAVARYSRPESS